MFPSVQSKCPASSPPQLQRPSASGSATAAKIWRPRGRRPSRSSPSPAVALSRNSARSNPSLSSTRALDHHHHDAHLLYGRCIVADDNGSGRARRGQCTSPTTTRRIRRMWLAWKLRARTISRHATSMRMGRGRRRRVETGRSALNGVTRSERLPWMECSDRERNLINREFQTFF